MKFLMSEDEAIAELIAFEKDIAEIYNTGAIRAPVHLAGGNEKPLIELFKDIEEIDWICGAWRFHYHCLLKGVPPERLKADILAGKSITLCYPEYRVITSAIAGGIIPIALGLAWSMRNRGMLGKVWCFVGDMTMYMGAFAEASRYAFGNGLPIKFVVEDNGRSVSTPTHGVWGEPLLLPDQNPILGYVYQLPWPHSGSGTWVNF